MKKPVILLLSCLLLNIMPAVAQESNGITDVLDSFNFGELGIRLLINIIAIYILVRLIYFARHKNNDFQFTLILFNSVNFMICYLLSGANLEVGFAFGLFAIFSIMRYRTVTVPVKEMGYLFMSVAMGLINSLASVQDHYLLLIAANAFIILLPLLLDKDRMVTKTKVKTKSQTNTIAGSASPTHPDKNSDMGVQDITYERIDLIKPEMRNEMIADLRNRTGLSIYKVEITSIDLMHDTALIKAFYHKSCKEHPTNQAIENGHPVELSTNHI